MTNTTDQLLQQVRNCTICAEHFAHTPRPVVIVHPAARILIIGQAPGRKVHASGIPWDDASGKNLRNWLGVSTDDFYDATKFGIVPMGFCYPGTGKSGDLPPRPECAPKWHNPLLKMMPEVKLTLLIGLYAQNYYLGSAKKKTLTDTVNHWEDYLPTFIPLPHPSPRNGIWMRRNPWFEKDIVPFLRKKVAEALG